MSATDDRGVAATADTWVEANQRYLSASLARVRRALERHVEARRGLGAGGEVGTAAATGGVTEDRAEPLRTMTVPPALDRLCAAFGLSPFERDVLLLCAGAELDAAFGPLCAVAQGDPRRVSPTFSLALAALPGPHWTALTPASPLRHWRLIHAAVGDALTTSPLRIDERILHYLTGVSYLDERLQGLVHPPARSGGPAPIAPRPGSADCRPVVTRPVRRNGKSSGAAGDPVVWRRARGQAGHRGGRVWGDRYAGPSPSRARHPRHAE